MLRPILTALLCFASFSLHLTAADLSPAETNQLLGKLQEHRAKFPSLTADFTEEKTLHILAKPITSQGSLSFQAPNKFKREQRGDNRSTMVSNGQKLWIYYPNFNRAELYTLGKEKFFDEAIEALTAGLNFQHVSDYYKTSATHDGDGYHLKLVPKGGGLKRLLKQLIVDLEEDYKIARTTTVLPGPDGDQVVTTYHNQHPAPVPASVFDYTPPAGASIVQPLGK